MLSITLVFIFALIGILSGLMSGLIGIGGGIVIIPALVYFAGFSQKMATGTSLAVLLPPIGLMAVIEYFKQNEINIPAAIIIASCFIISAWVSAQFAISVDDRVLKIIFGVLLTIVGFYFTLSGLKA